MIFFSGIYIYKFEEWKNHDKSITHKQGFKGIMCLNRHFKAASLKSDK